MNGVEWEVMCVFTWKFAWIPHFYRNKDTWPRFWQFHWLFFYIQGTGTPK